MHKFLDDDDDDDDDSDDEVYQSDETRLIHLSDLPGIRVHGFKKNT